jgi:hypothetical protein
VHLAAEVDVRGLGEEAEGHFVLFSGHVLVPAAKSEAGLCPIMRKSPRQRTVRGLRPTPLHG